MILAGDIGGTHTRLGLFDPAVSPLTPARTQDYASRDFPGLAEIAVDFLAKGSQQLAIACFGVAGPVVNGKSAPTNLPWQLDESVLSARLGVKTMLINDLEANAYGISALTPADLVAIQKGKPGISGNASVISAGTGLGQAGLFWDGRSHQPFACEGGHATFAPSSALEIQLLEYLWKRFPTHVSWERVLSGPGLCNIYEFFRDTGRAEEPAWLAEKMKTQNPAAVISDEAIHGHSPLCTQSLDLFISLYGSEAGNLALKIMSLGGVYLGGGIAPRIIEQLKSGSFGLAFNSKGRMQPMLENIPVYVVVNDRAALLGAARCGVIHL